jgi:hypothetical protein
MAALGQLGEADPLRADDSNLRHREKPIQSEERKQQGDFSEHRHIVSHPSPKRVVMPVASHQCPDSRAGCMPSATFADINLSIRLSELTKAPVSRLASGEPHHLVVRLTDPELFRCPSVLMSEVGAAYFDDEEAARLREYFLKGGFLWVDDFWGNYAWTRWVEQITKVFGPAEYPIVDIPNDHVLFRTLFEVRGVPQVPSINFWFGSGGGTSERGVDSAEVHGRAIVDDRGRIMVLMTHNTDISDSWEREAEDPGYFYRFSVNGYALAINALLYAMTH